MPSIQDLSVYVYDVKPEISIHFGLEHDMFREIFLITYARRESFSDLRRLDADTAC